MTERYYLANVPKAGEPAMLEGDEARHLSKVMRKKIGEEVELFDGNGSEYSAVIDKILRDQVILSIQNRQAGLPENERRLILAVALPKGDRQKWMIEKLTELGCQTVIPLTTQFGVAKTTPEVLNRLRRGVIEASKQCRRSHLMSILEEKTLEWIASEYPEIPKILAHPVNCDDFADNFSKKGKTTPFTNWVAEHPEYREIIVLIGPEGGFSEEEVKYALEQQWIPAHFGRKILRTETAAITACALYLYHVIS